MYISALYVEEKMFHAIEVVEEKIDDWTSGERSDQGKFQRAIASAFEDQLRQAFGSMGSIKGLPQDGLVETYLPPTRTCMG